jgi:hypothetical protein
MGGVNWPLYRSPTHEGCKLTILRTLPAWGGGVVNWPFCRHPTLDRPNSKIGNSVPPRHTDLIGNVVPPTFIESPPPRYRKHSTHSLSKNSHTFRNTSPCPIIDEGIIPLRSYLSLNFQPTGIARGQPPYTFTHPKFSKVFTGISLLCNPAP